MPVPPELTAEEHLRLPLHNGHLLAWALRRNASRPVLTLGDVVLTGEQVADRIARYAAALHRHGVSTGDPVGVLALNRPEVVFTIGAGQCLGHRRTALHPLGGVDDHAFVLADAGVETLLIDPVPAFVERARELLARVPGLRRVLTLGPVPEALADVGLDLIAAAEAEPPGPLRVVDLPADHAVSVTYTGGTTGRPKGVVGTAGGMAAMTQIQLTEWEWPDRPSFLACTPLSHAGAAFLVPVMFKGGRLVVLPRFDPAEVLRTIETERITATMLVPSMIYALLDHPDSRTRDLSSLETVYYGAASIDPGRLAEAIERFGPIFAQYYGQSEAPMAISYLPRAEHDPARLTSCGRPTGQLRTALLDPQGQPVPPGEPGEICVAGPLLAAGYRNLPEVTAETFRDGWLRTGDLAREDPEGYWHIVGRCKDMIVSGGFNVYPKEVEDVIAADPAVADVAVIGLPDARWGEAVTAVIVLAAGGLEARDDVVARLQAAVRQAKGSVMVPKHVLVVDTLPLTALGKPDKKAVRVLAADRLQPAG